MAVSRSISCSTIKRTRSEQATEQHGAAPGFTRRPATRGSNRLPIARSPFTGRILCVKPRPGLLSCGAIDREEERRCPPGSPQLAPARTTSWNVLGTVYFLKAHGPTCFCFETFDPPGTFVPLQIHPRHDGLHDLTGIDEVMRLSALHEVDFVR